MQYRKADTAPYVYWMDDEPLTCPPGTTNATFGCLDVNECLEDPCDSTATCQNTLGSFICECANSQYYDQNGECI